MKSDREAAPISPKAARVCTRRAGKTRATFVVLARQLGLSEAEIEKVLDLYFGSLTDIF